jgi:hypothetical protein
VLKKVNNCAEHYAWPSSVDLMLGHIDAHILLYKDTNDLQYYTTSGVAYIWLLATSCKPNDYS